MILSDDNVIKINKVNLCGLVKGIDIKASAIVEDLEVEGKGKRPKQATGFEDATIDIELVLLDDIKGKTKDEKLIFLQNLFKKSGQKIPNVYDIVNKHINQRNIYKVIIKDFSTKENNKKDEITVTLNFVEYEAVGVKVKANKSVSNSSEKSSVSSVSTSQTLKKQENKKLIYGPKNPNADNPYQSYLALRGQPPKKRKSLLDNAVEGYVGKKTSRVSPVAEDYK